LEITIFSGIDERVDAAVGDHEYHCKVVEPADENDKLVETSDVRNTICKTKTFPETFATTKRQTTEQHYNVN